jgi:hypothetical protein
MLPSLKPFELSTMTTFRTTTVIVNVKKNSEDSLRRLLDEYGDVIQNRDAPIAFAHSDTIHFARWVLVDPPKNRPEGLGQLVFCGHFDDIPRENQLQEVVRIARAALDRIYSQCEGYPDELNRTDDSRQRYLEVHSVGANAIFIGAPERTQKQIRDEGVLRDGIENLLNDRDFSNCSALDVVKAIRDFVANDPLLKWAMLPAPPRRRTLLQLTAFVIGVVLLSPLIAVWLFVLRLFFERTDKPLDLMPSGLPPELLRSLERREDFYVQNQFSQLMDVKPGLFRSITLKMVLWATNFLSRNFFTNGEISHIPSIHFASWTIIDDGRRLLFQSNFDGSWDSYLGDFIDKAAFGLNAFLSNCSGFPKTHFLFFKGVNDVEHYKAWARYANIPTQVWYTAYPNLNVKNINANSKIRLGLLHGMDEAQARKWLRYL